MLTRPAGAAMCKLRRGRRLIMTTYRTQPLEPHMPVSLVVRRLGVSTLALIAAFVALPRPAAAQQPAPAMQPPASFPPQVVTTGTGEVRLVPDRATVLVAVETRAATAKAAAAENARIQTATLNALQELGIPRERLSTVGFDVQPDYRYDPQGQTAPKVIGYVVRNTVRAEVRPLDMLSRVLDAALASGANAISGVQFESSKAQEGQRQALANAVADARAQAESMAKAAGGSLAQLVELNSSQIYRPLPERMQMQAADVRAANAPSTPINPGELVIMATVTGRWAFK